MILQIELRPRLIISMIIVVSVSYTHLIPEPSFAMYRQSARVAGNQIVSPQYAKNDLAFPTQAITEATDEKTKLVVICNPNKDVYKRQILWSKNITAGGYYSGPRR